MAKLEVNLEDKLTQIIKYINHNFPEICIVDINILSRVNTVKQNNEYLLVYTLESDIEALDHMKISTEFNKDIFDINLDILFESFANEYLNYCELMGIDRSTY